MPLPIKGSHRRPFSRGERLRSHAAALLASTALVSGAAAVALTATLTLMAPPARADGGAGGGGAAGGTTNTGPGGTGTAGAGTGGGGGGGAGVNGGQGGAGSGGASGGAGSTSVDSPGGFGTGGAAAGDGGGGGGGGRQQFGVPGGRGVQLLSSFTASAGGAGGNGNGSGGGGGGGAGAYDLFNTAASGASGSITIFSGAIRTGGAGGNGGTSGTGAGGSGGSGGTELFFPLGANSITLESNAAARGGAGGNGGVGGGGTGAGGIGGDGIFVINSTISLTTGAAVQGGNGGTGGIAGAGGTGIVGSNLTILNSGTISGGLSGDGVTRANAITFTGGSNFLNLNPSGTQGALTGNIDVTGSLTFNQPNAVSLSNAITGSGSITQIGTGTLTLTGASTYSGPTNINAGILNVNGSLASTVFVNSGGTLMGTGTIGGLNVGSGGTFAPGNSPGTMTVAGNLAFQSGASYFVQVNPTTASITNVSGNASLAGTVGAFFAPGTYIVNSYPILTAGGGLTGTFNALATSGLPPDFQTSLSYTANTAFLNLRAQLVPEPTSPTPTPTPTPLPTFTVNELNVGHAIDNFFNNGGALPPAFAPLFNLTGNNLTSALDQLSGEAATGAQKVAFQLTDQFLNLMLDPFVDGRSGVGGADHPALGFAPERDNTPPDIALAYASVFKAPQKAVPIYEPRWTVWGAGYGGSNRTTGDVALIGSHDLSARTVGLAGGFDYRLTPDTVVGLAFAGGGTNWSLSQGLGGGKSDAFQAGLYGATKYGPAYLAAAFAFANHWMSTDRLAFGDHLTADFNAQSYGGRLEGGYRFATPFAGITPYAAIQAQSFHTPGYTESGVIPNGFALTFNGRDATDTRSELGARFDRVLAVYSNAVLALRARVAWAHDWVSDPTLTPLFQALPGASFIVNGALLPQNAALASAGGELRFGNGITLLAKFDGEFASHSSTYGGTGTFRYRW